MMDDRSAPHDPAGAPLAERLAVYLVADPEQTERDLVETVAAALGNGVTCVQLRAKRLGGRDALALADGLREQCRSRNALFIVNDRIDLALAAQADGVHLGVHDLPLAAARAIAGPDLIVGYSPQTVDEAADARRRGADYVGVGPVFATASKDDAGEPIGIAGLVERARAAGIPSVGIGGITPDNAAEVIRAGADGVAVIRAILAASDPDAAAAQLARAVQWARAELHG